ncbi:TRAP transporter small permease [Marinobacterium lutimaris]|uniref:TRAP transporter small permease protein n=1 Tax=Marinobacterium lutimaris TaxID=568106 RepID=A0A1H6B213_9GAMM|nr:TRAP transporter small permease [Marinobacterium lutimaris]SEG54660.1 TRAP-type C4-dicarboxylate transport system, small permease component [Marinobacterium lutimaris]
MKLLERWLDRTAQGVALLGALGILAMMVHITLDIFLRSSISVSIPATQELVTRYYMVTLALLPLAWVERKRSMIFVEAFSGLFGSRGLRVVDSFVALFSASVYAILAVATWDKAMEQYDIGSYVMSLNFPMPVWPTYLILPVAFGLSTLVTLARIPLLFTKDREE